MRTKYIVCAALCLNDIIIAGPRHFDSVMRSQIKAIAGDKKKGMFARAEQGFVDQFGTFYNREDAMKIVKGSGQLFNEERNGVPKECLFSEGLY